MNLESSFQPNRSPDPIEGGSQESESRVFSRYQKDLVETFLYSLVPGVFEKVTGALEQIVPPHMKEEYLRQIQLLPRIELPPSKHEISNDTCESSIGFLKWMDEHTPFLDIMLRFPTLDRNERNKEIFRRILFDNESIQDIAKEIVNTGNKKPGLHPERVRLIFYHFIMGLRFTQSLVARHMKQAGEKNTN